MTVTLTARAEERLQALAARRGQAPEAVIETALDALLQREGEIAPVSPTAAPLSPTLALFHRWSAEAATDDPEEIQRRTRETDELSAALQAAPLSLRVPTLPEVPERNEALEGRTA